MATSEHDDQVQTDVKRTAFDKEFRALVKQGKETIHARYGKTIELGENRVELVCLNRYVGIYDNMQPEEHYCYFETLYNRCRTDILNCLEDDHWIRAGRLNIQFGQGLKGMKKEMARKCKQIRLMLSDIYLIACDLQEKAEQALDGIDEQFAQEAGGKDLIRPSILLLHLMRIFYHLNSGEDKTKLGQIVTQIENDLGVSNKTVVSSVAPQNAMANVAGGGLSSIFSMATEMMTKMGYTPPEGMVPPSENEISNVISNVFNNEVTQNAIQGMFSGLEGCNDFSTAIKHVVNNVADPETFGAIQQTVEQTANFGNDSTSESQS